MLQKIDKLLNQKHLYKIMLSKSCILFWILCSAEPLYFLVRLVDCMNYSDDKATLVNRIDTTLIDLRSLRSTQLYYHSHELTEESQNRPYLSQSPLLKFCFCISFTYFISHASQDIYSDCSGFLIAWTWRSALQIFHIRYNFLCFNNFLFYLITLHHLLPTVVCVSLHKGTVRYFASGTRNFYENQIHYSNRFMGLETDNLQYKILKICSGLWHLNYRKFSKSLAYSVFLWGK